MIIEIPVPAPSVFAGLCNLCGMQSSSFADAETLDKVLVVAGWKEAECKSPDGGPPMPRHLCPDCLAAVRG